MSKLTEIEEELLLLHTKVMLKSKKSDMKITSIDSMYDEVRDVWTFRRGTNVVKLKIYSNLEEPYPDKFEGKLSINFEQSQNVNPLLEQWVPNISKIVAARFIDRVVRAGVVDLSKLVWNESAISLQIDIHSVNENGDILDLALAGVVHALSKHTIKIEDTEVTNWFRMKSTAVTVFKYQDICYTEPTEAEKLCMDAALIIAIDALGNIVGLQKYGKSIITKEFILSSIEWVIANKDILLNRI